MFTSKFSILSAFACLALALPAGASVVLTSATGGVYTYAFSLAPGAQLPFNIGDTITFSDMVGVTNASVSGPDLAGLLTTCGITATTVCFGAPAAFDLDNIQSTTVDFGTLTIDAPGTTPGSIFYQLDLGGDTSGGDVGGPRTLTPGTPEPGGLPLIAGGLSLLLLGSPRCRRRAAPWSVPSA